MEDFFLVVEEELIAGEWEILLGLFSNFGVKLDPVLAVSAVEVVVVDAALEPVAVLEDQLGGCLYWGASARKSSSSGYALTEVGEADLELVGPFVVPGQQIQGDVLTIYGDGGPDPLEVEEDRGLQVEVIALAGQKVGRGLGNKFNKDEGLMGIGLVKEGEDLVGVGNRNIGVLNSSRNEFLKAIDFDMLLEAGGIDNLKSKVGLIQQLVAIFFIPGTGKLNIIGQLYLSEG